MRLWHYKLIPVLPQKQLISQWRECIAIKRQWEKGTLKHPLVNYVMKHSSNYFMNYVVDIVEEMSIRKIKYQEKYYDEIIKFCALGSPYVNYPEHNNRYLKQCYYNLQEKYDRGMITDEEWNKIEEVYNEISKDKI